MDIRKKVGKRLRGFAVTQGACYGDDGHIYMVFERKKSKKKTHRCKIVKLTKDQKVVKVSGALKLGHGNDICYRDGILYVTHSDSSKVIHRVDAKTLKQMKGIKVQYKSGGWNGITCYKNGFLLRKIGGNYVFEVDAKMRVIRKFKLKKSFKTSQGICWHGGRLYRGSSILQSKRNYVSIYTNTGRYCGKRHLDIKCELEGVFFIGEQLYVTYYKKYKKGGKKHYEAHIKRLG